MSSFDQGAVERAYQRWARVYDWLTPFYLLGNEGRLRRETIQYLDLKPGQRVLDTACGTGRNFPLILERIGSTGSLLGLDYTDAMLAHARERVARAGWKNVELVQGDAASADLGQKFDAVLCTLAIGVIPGYRRALQRMAAHTKPDGRLAIGDARRSVRPAGAPFNWLADLLGYGAAEDMTRRPWEDLRELVADFHYEEWFSGFFYVVGGRVRRARG